MHEKDIAKFPLNKYIYIYIIDSHISYGNKILVRRWDFDSRILHIVAIFVVIKSFDLKNSNLFNLTAVYFCYNFNMRNNIEKNHF